MIKLLFCIYKRILLQGKLTRVCKDCQGNDMRSGLSIRSPHTLNMVSENGTDKTEDVFLIRYRTTLAHLNVWFCSVVSNI